MVDFTAPFMEDGGGILTKKVGGDTPDLLNLFRPYSLTSWLLVIGAILLTSVTLLLVDKFKVKAGEESEESDSRPWTISDCFMVTFGSLMTQGEYD